MRLEQVTRLPGFACGVVGPLALSVWDGVATPVHARAAASLLASLAKTEKGMLVMAVLGPNNPPPDGEVRDILAQELTKCDDRIRAVAQTIEGQGFRAATLRAVLTGMSLVLRTKRPEKVCSSVEEAAQFLAPHSQGRISAYDIERAVVELREPG
jgi:hypothetical protein